MGFWNKKASAGSDMGSDILYSLIKGGCLFTIIIVSVIALIIWILNKI